MAHRPPDGVGYLLDEAQRLLEGAGWQVAEVVETRPPRRLLEGPRRVVRQRLGAGGVLLVVCGERPAPREDGQE